MIPWHRVVNGKGGVSTDGEHPGLQRAMLEKEGVRFGKDGLIDLERFAWQTATHAPRADKKRRVHHPRRRDRA
jgi:hypothetical protein